MCSHQINILKMLSCGKWRIEFYVFKIENKNRKLHSSAKQIFASDPSIEISYEIVIEISYEIVIEISYEILIEISYEILIEIALEISHRFHMRSVWVLNPPWCFLYAALCDFSLDVLNVCKKKIINANKKKTRRQFISFISFMKKKRRNEKKIRKIISGIIRYLNILVTLIKIRNCKDNLWNLIKKKN